ncbi:thioesterase family protein [uncultured Gilvimarinus sp.]|uniref:acyl-CoA thioesterase n=1 Tax=uncultured Gilvimarinus sp. TaxID=1689143 RepID=UPI0030ED7F62|tara:strand:+ start:1746 stop:2195 length:450 start_codon:yes stop_codon:yes gene_type:complete
MSHKECEQSPVTASVVLRVPFYDVDSMDIVWHGHYLKYFEDARCALLDKIAYNYHAMRESGYGFPVVDVRLKYVKPATFNRAIRVEATLSESDVRLKIDYRIVDEETAQVLTKGYSVQVAVALDSGEMCFALPDILQQKLARYRREGDQ